MKINQFHCLKYRLVYLNEECDGHIHMAVNKYRNEQLNGRNFGMKTYRNT